MILPYRAHTPRIAPDAFIAPGASVIGDVEIGAESSVWFGSVVRGDVHYVRIGARTNLQDGTIVHVTHDGFPTVVGDEVTVGHGCILHACTLHDRAFIGMDATILDGGVVETDAMLAAGALLTPGKTVPTGQLWAGRPARYLRDLRPDEIAAFKERNELYVKLAAEYRTA
jgi:carbonic anhydrase/acetyltransferase-like protein (isoleucine patch superfamily)